MSFHNRPAKADMGALIVLGIVCESEWQVGVQLNPTVTSGRELWNKQIYVLINLVSLIAAGWIISEDLLLLLYGCGGNVLPNFFLPTHPPFLSFGFGVGCQL